MDPVTLLNLAGGGTPPPAPTDEPAEGSALGSFADWLDRTSAGADADADDASVDDSPSAPADIAVAIPGPYVPAPMPPWRLPDADLMALGAEAGVGPVAPGPASAHAVPADRDALDAAPEAPVQSPARAALATARAGIEGPNAGAAIPGGSTAADTLAPRANVETTASGAAEVAPLDPAVAQPVRRGAATAVPPGRLDESQASASEPGERALSAAPSHPDGERHVGTGAGEPAVPRAAEPPGTIARPAPRTEVRTASRLEAERLVAQAVLAGPVAAGASGEASQSTTTRVEARRTEAPLPAVWPPLISGADDTDVAAPVDARAAIDTFARIERAGAAFQAGTDGGADRRQDTAQRGTPAHVAAAFVDASTFEATAGRAAASPSGAEVGEAPATRPTPPATIGQQVIRAMHLQWRDGMGEARLRLTPEHLGEVTVRLQVGAQGVSAVLSAESPEVRAWMAAHEDDLRRGLEQQGLRLASLRVNEEAANGRRREAPDREAPRRDRRPSAQGAPAFELSV
ncbi:MAG: flagellar hook-length control protein FliK [Acidobacteriota bacterium]